MADLRWDDGVADKAKEAVQNAIEGLATEIKGRSQELCPVDSGTLQGSCVVTQDDENTFYVSYGGAASDYAMIQHENLQFHHKVGQAKYLEQAFDELTAELPSRIEERLRDL